jgi:hypothetical protein
MTTMWPMPDDMEEASLRRTYWERLQDSARLLKRPAADIDRVELWYAPFAQDLGGCFVIEGREEAQAFLAQYISFADVESAYALPPTLDHIRCVIVGKGIFEEFDRDVRWSLLEREIFHLGPSGIWHLHH